MRTILVTGSTDGIGLEAAKMLYSRGHHVLLHGRNPPKLEAAERQLSAPVGDGRFESYAADLSVVASVEAFASLVAERRAHLDVLINNAGVYMATDPITPDGLDVRFAVNTIAPYLLTRRLLPLLGTSGRVVNVSSAAQAPVNPKALAGQVRLSDGAAYAQSKLALNIWSRSLALQLGERGPAIIAVNPGSLLGTKMVREAFSMAGADVRIGGDILTRAALSDEFRDASGQYYDNDAERFASPHSDALDPSRCEEVVRVIESVLTELGVSGFDHT